MHGWIGKMLRVDLTTGKIGTEPLNPALARDYIGARGLGTKLFFDEVDPAVDPLSPANKLMFVTGPLTGTLAPCGRRYDVVTKSPLTGTIAASNSGGTWGPELKFAGYDLLIVEGKAAKPVYLWIEDAKVEIRDAAHLWGKQVPETTEALYAETMADAKVACIGPAGENLSHIAAVMNDMHRAAGRSGVGAVMGSKNLKAVVVRGTGAVTVPDKAGSWTRWSGSAKILHDSPATGPGGMLNTLGTNALINPMNAIGMLPTANFQESHFATADNVGGESLAAKLLQRTKGCFACVISCGRVTKVTNPKYAGEGEGPEYETAFAFGPDCCVDDLDAVTKANYYLQRDGARHDLHGRHHRLCDGAVRARLHHARGHRRPAAGIRQCRGDGGSGAADRARRRVRQEAAARLVADGRPLRPPGTVDDLQEAGIRRPTSRGRRRAWA